MKLSKLYSNKPKIFQPINFAYGLNVVMAEIRLPVNFKKDTHNLGKTILIYVLDFCFLEERDKKKFPFKQEHLLKDFVFLLEIELDDGTFLTIRRSVEQASKICFKRHQDCCQDFSQLPVGSDWDHDNVSYDRAKDLLDGLLDWRYFKPWNYRKGIGYLLRTQDDYRDVFHLDKFKGKHADWKPFVAHLLGFDAEQVIKRYKLQEEIETKEREKEVLERELVGVKDLNLNAVEAILRIKHKDAERKQSELDSFNLQPQDLASTGKLVDEIDLQISDLNKRRYYLQSNKKKITSSIKETKIMFEPSKAEQLFNEAGIVFPGQIKKSFEQLIQFNKAITDERRSYLKEELTEIDFEIQAIDEDLKNLSSSRAQKLSFLSSTDIFEKYKMLANELINIRADIASLEKQKKFYVLLRDLNMTINNFEKECVQLQTQIENNIYEKSHDENSLFSKINEYFNEIVEEVLDRSAVLQVKVNQEGNLEFEPSILDVSGIKTSADEGHTYRKLLCVAFDMALLRAHLNNKFPKFVYHDGVFESLDDRKKENLLNVIKRYTDFGIQQIITLIDTDLPHRLEDEEVFSADEIILALHDDGDDGRLFKMPPW